MSVGDKVEDNIHPNPGPLCRKGMRKEDLSNSDMRIDKKSEERGD